MRWILCGKNDAAVHALEFLCERGDEVRVVGTRGDGGADGWQRSLRVAAEKLGVPVDQPRRINAPEFVERLAAFDARALISIQYDQILKGRLLRGIGCPCLNLHFALLPRHRGVAPIAWAVLAGDAEAGVTLHHMAEEIDAGDLIARRSAPIEPDDTAREVYDKVSRAAADLFRESYPFAPELLARVTEQDDTQASYHRNGDFDFSRRRADWSRPADELQRWLRAMIFPPMQYPEVSFDGRVLHVVRVAGTVGGSAGEPPGRVVACGPGALDVAAAGGTVRIAKLADPADATAKSDEILRSIRPGDRLV